MPGYKLTEIGLVPDDWDVSTIESVTPRGIRNGIVDGPFGSNLKTIHYRKSGIPIVTSGYVTDGVFNADTYMYVDDLKFQAEKRSAVKPGDIIMAKIGARCGASAILPDEHPIGILSGNALKISVDQLRHSTFYVWQVLWNLYIDDRINDLRTVGAQPAISMANLKKYRIPLPPLTEQRAIAATLFDMDKFISGLDQLILKKRDIKQATMQQLLTSQQRLPGFSEKWEIKRLGEVLSRMANGALYIPDEKNGVPITRIETIANGSIDLKRVGMAAYTSELEKYKLEVGDILFSHINSVDHIGKVAYFGGGETIYHGMNLLLLRAGISISPDFLFLLLSSEFMRRKMRLLAKQAVSQASINTAELKGVELLIPTLPEQTAITTILSDMSSELTTLEIRRDKARQIKQSMLHELLTGRVRIPQLENAQVYQ